MSAPPPQVREIREAQGRSQVWLARKVGVTTTTLRGYESGRVQPPLPKARAVAAALGVSMAEAWPPPKVPPGVVDRGVSALADGVRRRHPGALVEVEAATP